jgi:ABC-2 type transport system permease protein
MLASGAATVAWHSAANAYADFRAVYTWRTWVFGWLGRMLAQVTFFTYLGILLGSPEQVRFMVLGNAVMTCVVESMMVVASTSWERWMGTLPLIAAAPAGPLWIFFGRSLQWPLSGSGTSLVALFALGPFFGVTFRVGQVPAVVALVLLIALSTYCFGLFVAALTLLRSGLRNLASNALYLTMMAICGVQVPVHFWPGWVRGLAQAFPLTHGLEALRALHSGAPVLAAAGRAAGLGLVWLALAHFAFRWVLRRGRQRGGLED